MDDDEARAVDETTDQEPRTADPTTQIPSQQAPIPAMNEREWKEHVEKRLEGRFGGIEERNLLKETIISFLVGLAAGIIAHPIGYWIALTLFAQ